MAALQAFDVADHLDNDEVIAEFLTAALEGPDPEVKVLSLLKMHRLW